MSAYNSAGQSRRGSAARVEREHRRGSASGGGIGEQAAAGAYSQDMVRKQGSRDSIGSHGSGGGGGGGSGQGRKGSVVSQAPVINNIPSTTHTSSRRSSFGSDGGGGRRSSTGGGGGGAGSSRSRRVSFGTETNEGDGWEGGEGGVVDPWATERDEASFEDLDHGKGRRRSRR